MNKKNVIRKNREIHVQGLYSGLICEITQLHVKLMANVKYDQN